MKVLELFAGTRSIGKEFEKKGHNVFSIDYDEQHKDCYHTDIEYLTVEDIISTFGIPDIIWASPDCTTYSIAGIRHHRVKTEDDMVAVSDYAKKSDRVNENMVDIINYFVKNHGVIYYVENPRGAMRKTKMIKNLIGYTLYTVTYCQYGDNRMKPTDIWTNHPSPQFKPMCKNGDICHVSAPRGSRTGTQGLKTIDRSRIPKQLCKHIVERSEFIYNHMSDNYEK